MTTRKPLVGPLSTPSTGTCDGGPATVRGGGGDPGAASDAPAAIPTFSPNPYLSEARFRKANGLASAALALGFTVEEVEKNLAAPDLTEQARDMAERIWRSLARMGNVNPPHSQATKNMVVELMRRHEAIRAEVRADYGEDPLRGLPRA